jgi:uncharacterized membrane protein
MRRLSDRRAAVFFALVLASGLCVSLVAARGWRSGTDGYRFLIWNLELAWAPFLLALAFYDGHRRGVRRVWLGLLAGLWLLFLPNAPYMVTDLVHLGRIPGAPLWYDGGMVAAFAAVGLLLGLASIFLVHAVALRALGPVVGWLALVPVLALCSLGVFLGRFERLNSWDALADPVRLARLAGDHLADPLASRRALAAVAAYAVFLAVAYLVLYALSSLRLELDRERRPTREP